MIVAVDTGGTKTLIASFNEDGVTDDQFKFPTPSDTATYVETLRSALKERYSDQSVDAVVVAVPGIIKDGVAIWCNNLGWKNFDVATALKGVLGDAPVFIENDANLAGLSETRLLDQVPPQSIYVTVSTGIGTGIITDGSINHSLRHSEGGHMLVEFDGKLQEWEQFASGRAIKDVYGQYARDITDPNTWHEIADRISRGFLALIPLLQPDVVIFGGSIGTYFERYGNDLTQILQQELPDHIACPEFKQAQHPEEAVIYGCYQYAGDKLNTA